MSIGAAMKRFLQDTRGATAIEYSLLASLIAIAIVTSVTTVGSRTTTLFQSVANGFGR